MPVFDYSSIRTPSNRYSLYIYLLTSWGNSPHWTNELALMCTLHGPAGHNLLPFSKFVINGDVEIRESGARRNNPLFVVLAANNSRISRIMVDEVTRNILVHGLQVALVPFLFNQFTDK